MRKTQATRDTKDKATAQGIKDAEGHYDVDGTSQLKNYQVVVASGGKYIPPDSFCALIKRVQKVYSITHHN